MAMFLKRDDDDGYLIPKTAIVLLVMLGAGFVIAAAYGMHRVMGFGGHDKPQAKSMSIEQQQYMAGVRTRNVNMLREQLQHNH